MFWNHKGSSLTETMVLLVVASASVMTIVKVSSDSNITLTRSISKISLESTIANVVGQLENNILNDTTYSYTRAQNTGLQCTLDANNDGDSNCWDTPTNDANTTTQVQIRNPDNSIFYDGTASGQEYQTRFNEDGEPCPDNATMTSGLCPIKLNLVFEPVCENANSCWAPSIQFTGGFVIFSESGKLANPKKFNVNITRFANNGVGGKPFKILRVGANAQDCTQGNWVTVPISDEVDEFNRVVLTGGSGPYTGFNVLNVSIGETYKCSLTQTVVGRGCHRVRLTNTLGDVFESDFKCSAPGISEAKTFYINDMKLDYSGTTATVGHTISVYSTISELAATCLGSANGQTTILDCVGDN